MQVSDSLIDLAGQLADVSGEILKQYFRVQSSVKEKPDSTPVTIADTKAESAMRELIRSNFPDHGILGEEGGFVGENSEYMWILDPIDGTKNYVAGSHNFGTLISLTYREEYIVGIINQPVLSERWVGIKHQNTTFNGNRIETRKCKALDNAWMTSTSPTMFEGRSNQLYASLVNQVKHALFGNDCIGYGLLATGSLDIVCEANLKFWDFAALVPIIEGAGGIISDWQGNPLTSRSEGYVLACGDKRVHEKALNLLQQ